MIAQVIKYDYDIINPAVKDILYTANKFVYPDDVVKKLKKLVREFKSTNSQRFEQIDRELEIEETQHINA